MRFVGSSPLALVLSNIKNRELTNEHITISAIAEQIFKTFDFSHYKGCQIIDMNPGFGFYSKCLNAAIQPSKHVLLEPDERYKDFMNDLTKKNDTFKYS